MRPLGMAREWARAGHEVHVLTGPGDRGGEFSPDLLAAAEASGATVHRAAAPGIPKPQSMRPAFESRPAELIARRRVSRLRQIMGQWKGFPDLQRSWILPAVAVGRQLHGQLRFDVVWTTSPPESVHFIGRDLALAGAPWVADFRDQWSEYLLARWDPLSRWLIDQITASVLSAAKGVTANSQGVADSIRRASGREVTLVRNGWDPPPPADLPLRSRTLGYFGRIDPQFQHPERLWPSLRELRERQEPWRVDFFSAPGGSGGAAIPVPTDLEDLVRVHAPLPHPRALQEMQSMTALLVLGWEARAADAPVAGKLYEYVGSRRPVLVCAPRHYEARQLIERAGLGLGAWSTSELTESLQALERLSVSESARRALSREATAADLVSLFAAVCH